MGNTSSSIIINDKPCPKVLTIGGVKKKFPQKYYDCFDTLPQEIQTNVITAIKNEIKTQYEKHGARTIRYLTSKVYEQLILDGYYCNIRSLTSDVLEEQITEFCNSLFGGHIPYIMSYNYEIIFVKNI